LGKKKRETEKIASLTSKERSRERKLDRFHGSTKGQGEDERIPPGKKRERW